MVKGRAPIDRNAEQLVRDKAASPLEAIFVVRPLHPVSAASLDGFEVSVSSDCFMPLYLSLQTCLYKSVQLLIWNIKNPRRRLIMYSCTGR